MKLFYAGIDIGSIMTKIAAGDAESKKLVHLESAQLDIIAVGTPAAVSAVRQRP